MRFQQKSGGAGARYLGTIKYELIGSAQGYPRACICPGNKEAVYDFPARSLDRRPSRGPAGIGQEEGFAHLVAG